jgi:hypothetical protein
MSQTIQILNHLSKAPITALEALHKYQCFRLAARINDLRMQGHTIHTEVTVKNGKRYATYHLLNKKPLE